MVIEFHATEPYSGLDLTKANYIIIAQSVVEKENVTVRVKSSSIIGFEKNKTNILMKINFTINIQDVR
jgi:hypothetical protein